MDRGPSRSDGELARLIAAGDEVAFMDAYDAHGAILFAVVARVLADREAAAEVVQEVFLTLWQRAAHYQPTLGTLRTWLVRIARNRALDRLRLEARRPRTVSTAEPSGLDAGTRPGPLEVLADHPGDEPAATFERRWTQAVVRAAMGAMPRDEVAVLALAYDEGLSQSEIAVRLELPIGTVKSRTRRGMARLREMLERTPDLVAGDHMEVRRGSR